MKKAHREVAIGTRATQEQQKAEHDQTWKDPYDEKTPTHNNFWGSNCSIHIFIKTIQE